MAWRSASFVLSSDEIISNDVSSSSQILYSAWSNLMLTPCIALFISSTAFFSSRISVWFFFMISVSLLNFSFYLCIVFLILLTCLSFFSYSLLSFLNIIILIPLSDNLWVSISSGSVTGKLMWSFSGVTFLNFHVPWSLALLSLHLNKQSPPLVSTDWFQKRHTITNQPI